MRVLFDSVVALMLAAVVGGALLYFRESREDEQAIQAAQDAVARISSEVRVRAATGKAELNGRGWPMTIDPEWFSDTPLNPLVTQERPWLEIAPPEHADLIDPPVRMAVDRTLAMFWYNPGTGVVRARVPVVVSDRLATELYNEINATALTSIFHDAGAVSSLSNAQAVEETASADANADSSPLPGESGEHGDLDPTVPRAQAEESAAPVEPAQRDASI